MAKKEECYLCGGKLRNGYCPDCGLDNTKIHRKHYHLNESYAVESMNGEEETASEECKLKAEPDETENKDQFHKIKAGNPERTRVHRRTVSGKVKLAAAAVVLAVVLIGLISEYAVDYHMTYIEQVENESETVYDPYEYVEKELAETGEYYEVELTKGEYLVGTHLPEGRYTARLLEGSGSVSVDDYENGIYLWQSFGTEEEYGDVELMEDIRLYLGAHLIVNDAVRLQMTTENGQTEEMEDVENPLTESVTLKKGKTLTVGEDILPGVYDIHADSGWTDLYCHIPDDSYEEGYYERSYWLSGEEGDDVYRNLYLKEGVEITAGENPLELIPSRVVGSRDYTEYYQYY